MYLETRNYREQVDEWPVRGKHIMAHYDDESIVVYQAYRPEIGDYAIANQRFGGAFSFERMSWIKPNFLWMMYRSGWATKVGQEKVLGVRIRRELFDEIYQNSVASSFGASGYADEAEWKRALVESEVRLQWDPDHDPTGAKVDRRAVQLGLRGEYLKRYSTECLEIIDMSAFVAEQRVHAVAPFDELMVPSESVYPMPAAVEEGV